MDASPPPPPASPAPEDSPYRVAPGTRFEVRSHDTSDTGAVTTEEQAEEALEDLREQIHDLQDRFSAEASHGLLVVLQGFDGAGKDNVISRVVSACDPAGLRVYHFKPPSGEEAAHDFLWRYHQHTPARGMVHVFDRSHYEQVVSSRVHDEVDADVLRARYESINDFERMLVREGIHVLKFFLHISKDAQAERVEERLRRRDKQGEFAANDVKERERWDDYDEAYEDAVNATSTDWAPWFVVPADHRWAMRVAVAGVIAGTLEALDPQYPGLDETELEEAGVEAP
jgi:PPK2 family polyphosphate:nucleotide phosphotransferase